MTEFNAQEIIDFLNHKFLKEFDSLADVIWGEFTSSKLKDCKMSKVFESVNKEMTLEYLKRREALLERYCENIRKVERLQTEIMETGWNKPSCSWCTNRPRDGFGCELSNECFPVEEKKLKRFKWRVTIEDFK